MLSIKASALVNSLIKRYARPFNRLIDCEGIWRYPSSLKPFHPIFDCPNIGPKRLIHLLQHERISEVFIVIAELFVDCACSDRYGHGRLVDWLILNFRLEKESVFWFTDIIAFTIGVFGVCFGERSGDLGGSCVVR